MSRSTSATLDTDPNTRPLPGVLQEIADVAGRDAALAVQAVKGGQVVFVASKLSDRNWLVLAVGRAKAQTISHHFTSGRSRLKLEIPIGEASSYLQARRKQHEAMIAAFERGASSNEIAAAGGVTERSARRFRGKYRAQLRKKASRA